ncbi:MAG: sugar ABC transporter permease [Oscillospiraceae bacterium]|nr:sugar ABC transporter permease [Oscillospiraceae bacterium]
MQQKKKKKTRRITDTNTPFARALILPSLLGVLVFFVVPSIIVVYYSFLDNPISKHFVWFTNYKNLLANEAFAKSAKNTLMLSFTAVPAAVIFSLMLANLLDAKIPGRSMFRTFFLSPMMVPVASIVLIWRVMFHQSGFVNRLLASIVSDGLHINDMCIIPPWTDIDWMKSTKCLVVIVLLFLWKNLGYNMILFLSGLNTIPKDLIEVAELEGAGKLWTMIHIKFRYLSPTFLFVTILSLINSFKLFREVYLLTGDYPYEALYLLQHFMNNTFRSLDYQKLSSAAIVMSIFMVIIMGVLFFTESIFGKDVEE